MVPEVLANMDSWSGVPPWVAATLLLLDGALMSNIRNIPCLLQGLFSLCRFICSTCCQNPRGGSASRLPLSRWERRVKL